MSRLWASVIRDPEMAQSVSLNIPGLMKTTDCLQSEHELSANRPPQYEYTSRKRLSIVCMFIYSPEDEGYNKNQRVSRCGENAI